MTRMELLEMQHELDQHKIQILEKKLEEARAEKEEVTTLIINLRSHISAN